MEDSYRKLAHEAMALLSASCAVMDLAIWEKDFILAAYNLSATVEETHALLVRIDRLESRSEKTR